VGTASGDTLYGLAGDDSLNGGTGNDVFVGGPGNDTFSGGQNNDTYIYNLGDGSDYIDEGGDVDTIQLGAGLTPDNVRFSRSGSDLLITDGVAGDQIRIYDQLGSYNPDRIEWLTYGDGTTISLTGGLPLTGSNGNDNLTGTGGGDLLYGLAGNDTLNGGTGDDVFVGGPGNDTLYGGQNNDTYIYNLGDGSDYIDEGGDVDTIRLGEGLTPDNVRFGRSGNDLLITDEVAGDQIRIYDQLGSYNPDRIEWLVYGDGTTISLTGGLPFTGSSGNDNMTGTGYGDTLYGLAGNDTLNGGTGNDVFVGGPGNDTLYGGQNNDTYIYNLGDGSDYIDEGGDVDTIQLGAGLTPDNVTFSKSGNDLLITDGVAGDQIRIYNEYGSSNPDRIEWLTYGDGTTIGLTVSLPVVGTTGADTLNGGSGNDRLYGFAGNDLLAGNAGDDALDGGAGADALIGGTGSDTYIVDDLNDVVTENSGEGTDLVQSSVSYSLSANVENLTLTGTSSINGIGNALANVLTGNAGSNILYGAGGNDTLTGGGGYDTYQFDTGMGQSVVNNLASDGNAAASGEIDFLSGVAYDQLWFEQKGNDLQVDLVGTTNHITISGWYGGNARAQVQSFDTADGLKLDSQLAQLVTAMATYSANNPGFDPTQATQMPTDSTLQNALSTAWHQ